MRPGGIQRRHRNESRAAEASGSSHALDLDFRSSIKHTGPTAGADALVVGAARVEFGNDASVVMPCLEWGDRTSAPGDFGHSVTEGAS
jgi:hypothetical protein